MPDNTPRVSSVLGNHGLVPDARQLSCHPVVVLPLLAPIPGTHPEHRAGQVESAEAVLAVVPTAYLSE